jgi:hypothetical protein
VARRRSYLALRNATEKEIRMKTFLIEREIPGAGELTDEQLRGITESADVIREHARTGRFPANLVVEGASVFDSTGPRDLPR